MPPKDEIHADIKMDANLKKAFESLIPKPRKSISPKRILKSGLYTIVTWSDGDITRVKRSEDEPDNDYAAFTAALAKRIYGSNSQVHKIVDAVTVDQKEEKIKKLEKQLNKALAEYNLALFCDSSDERCDALEKKLKSIKNRLDKLEEGK